MKKSMLKVLVFFALLVGMALLLDTFLDRQMKLLRYEDASVWNDISRGGIDAHTIIIGSSRAATHIDPQMIAQATGASCYNLGMMGHNFFIEHARYRYYLQHNSPPKTIILSLDYESLQRRQDLFNHTQFLAYLQDTIIGPATQQYQGFSTYDYKLPLLRYVGEQTLIFSLIKNAINPSRNQPDRHNGFFARNAHWDAQVDKILDTLQPYTVHPDSLSLAAFDSFLQYCRTAHISLIMVHTPTHPLGQAKVRNRAAIIQLYQQYASRYHYPFLDYAADTMCQQRAYFMNATHLNTQGAAIFTQKLITDINHIATTQP